MPKRLLYIFAGLLLLVLVLLGIAFLLFRYASSKDPIEHLYADNCAVCHGEQLERVKKTGGKKSKQESVCELVPIEEVAQAVSWLQEFGSAGGGGPMS